LFGPDRYDLQLAAACVTFVASVVPAACRLPIEPFGVIVGTGFAATVGAALGAGFGWDATTSATVLAVAVFVTTMSLRFVLRAAQLRVPQLPRTAEELQQDIDPEPEASVVRRTAAAVTYLNSLYITASLVFVAAFALLASSPEWACWTLALVFSAAVLLRARSLTVAWQRVPLAASGAMGLALVLDFRIGHASVSARGFALLALAVAATAILTAAGRPPARLLPIWGHIADLLETWTAIAIVPLLLQMLHAYARFRALIG
jgi:type VII secretion integral membrane protein EccD